MKCSTLLILLVVIFVLTYDPASGTIEKYLAPPPGSIKGFPPTAQQAVKDGAEEVEHLEDIQFGKI